MFAWVLFPEPSKPSIIISLNYIPPIKNKNAKALISGTVRLSIPFGVSASVAVAIVATPNEANSSVDVEKGHR